MKYFDIHVMFSHNNGYSVFVKGDFDEEGAVDYAIENNMFNEDGDEDYIDNVTEITQADYEDAIDS